MAWNKIEGVVVEGGTKTDDMLEWENKETVSPQVRFQNPIASAQQLNPGSRGRLCGIVHAMMNGLAIPSCLVVLFSPLFFPFLFSSARPLAFLLPDDELAVLEKGIQYSLQVYTKELWICHHIKSQRTLALVPVGSRVGREAEVFQAINDPRSHVTWNECLTLSETFLGPYSFLVGRDWTIHRTGVMR